MRDRFIENSNFDSTFSCEKCDTPLFFRGFVYNDELYCKQCFAGIIDTLWYDSEVNLV